MSPAANPAQQNFSIQSPATNFSELSLPSPSVRSPFVSASLSQPQSHLNMGNVKDNEEPVKSVKSANSHHSASSSHFATQLTQQQQFKKYNSASVPIYLTEAGFLRLLTPEADASGYSPLEIFLATNHLKKILLKSIQSEQTNAYPVRNFDTCFFKTSFFEFQLRFEASSGAYSAFSVNFHQSNNELQVDVLSKYFQSRILCPSYKSTQLVAFFNMLCIAELKFVKEILQLLELEMVFLGDFF